MRHAWVLVFAIACSTNGRTTSTSTERAKDAIPPSVTTDAATAPSGDAMAAGPTPEEIDAAFHQLGSEHGGADVRNVEWWRTNAAHVRPRLRAMLEDDKFTVADGWAIRILGDIGDPADVALLASVLTTSKFDTSQMEAAAALGVHPAREAGEALVAATEHANVDTASYATDGLGLRKTDADAARARLVQLLDHQSSTMRFHAVNALAELGGGKAALEKRKKLEKNAEVREAIVKALKRP